MPLCRTWHSPPIRGRRAAAALREITVVRFEDVTLRYGSGPDILQDINFEFAPGSFHFLIGPSGAGKSSLLKMMYLAQRPTSGRISLFGRDVTRLPRQETPLLRRRIGIVFQDFRLLDHLTAHENVALPLKISGQQGGKSDRNVTELLTWVGLAEHLDAFPPTLSGGQQQRVAIARAVIARPSLLLADEPTGNLDDNAADTVLTLLDRLVRASGRTMIIATHSVNVASRCDRVLELHNGKLEQTTWQK